MEGAGVIEVFRQISFDFTRLGPLQLVKYK